MMTKHEMTVAAHGDTAILITRRFDAPRQLVYDAHTKPELLKRWLFGPDGWELAQCDIDLRVGGKYRYLWRRAKDGFEMGMGGVFKEITPPSKLVATEKFDESWYPGDAVNEMVLTEKNGVTTLTLTIVYESREARDGVLQSPMDEGMEAGYDRLDGVLASLRG